MLWLHLVLVLTFWLFCPLFGVCPCHRQILSRSMVKSTSNFMATLAPRSDSSAVMHRLVRPHVWQRQEPALTPPGCRVSSHRRRGGLEEQCKHSICSFHLISVSLLSTRWCIPSAAWRPPPDMCCMIVPGLRSGLFYSTSAS
ncbi:hypothetical protein EDD17DRAFT_23012 [Pisolithus thermaeus]|nr:hypothetical protein EDD17DRAFT_23012 [Pisolithus thermaeus]